ncbi:MAG: fumarylacetoacetase [Phycisphaerales bacterium]
MPETTDPNARSWVQSANDPDSDFPIQNLPYGVFSRNSGPREVRRVGVAIGDFVLDLAEAWPELCPDQPQLGEELFDQPALNEFMSRGRKTWTLVRNRVFRWLLESSGELRDHEELKRRALLPIDSVTMHLPCVIGDYTDFYASEFHASNVGRMFRPDQAPLLPNWKHLPVGYHGRASSIVVSGTPIPRPVGQTKADDADAPTTGPCRLLDYELEVGFLIGPGNEWTRSISVDDAMDHIFGLVIVNDWSARDIQKWEYVPLGPFLAKNFATTISPWVVTMDALEPFRVKTERKTDDPAAQPYLDGAWNCGFDVNLEVAIESEQMRRSNTAPAVITRSNFKYMYWNICHMLAHQTRTGCNVRPGDLYASGTVSGPDKDKRGCLLELTWRGTEPVSLPSGEERKFLADGDTVIMRAHAGGDGRPRIGFGECRGRVLPAVES